MESITTRILIVDDDPSVADLLQNALGERYMVDLAASYEQASGRLVESSYQIVVTDVLLGGKSGLELLAVIKERSPGSDVVVITGFATVKIAVEALNKGARRFLPKPIDIAELRQTLESLLEERTTRVELAPYTVGKSLLLPNDLTLIPAIARDIAETAARLGHPDSFGFALRAIVGEALPNAIIHGNLAVDRETEKLDAKAVEKRLKDRRYSKRRLRIEYRVDDREARIRIEDEGPGFDYQNLPDPTDESKILELHGRGIFLLRQLADLVRWEGRGNVIEIVKRADPSAGPT